jgi:LPS-assembly protein
VWYKRYFDPTFGGAIVEGQRNVLLTGAQLTGYSFFNGARHASPLVSALRMSPLPGAGIEWRTDYDPTFRRFTNSVVTVDGRVSKYFASIGHAYVRSVPNLSPPFNQFRGLVGIGNEQRRGWSAAFSAYYDFRQAVMQFATTQVTYNLDCCGISVQYRRFSFGTRNENQYRIAFAVANIGSFGTLKRQERIF